MGSRREFLKSVAAIGALGVVGTPAVKSMEHAVSHPSSGDARIYWLATLDKIARPVLESLSRRELKKKMPVEAFDAVDRAKYTYLEAFGRLLCGISPWLAAQKLDASETARQTEFIRLAQAGLDAATNPTSPDFMNFTSGGQPLVDAAFMAQGILRARNVLWKPLDSRVKLQIVDALKSTRVIGNPTDSNWVMFSAMVEAALLTMGEEPIEDRLHGSVKRMLGWYKGDGVYGDGEFFHFDYYNSFVIHPMLLDVLAVLKTREDRFVSVHQKVLERSRRYACIQERLIAPDGTFPSIGRSTTYRFGALQVLAQIAWLRELPSNIKPGQVRCALTAVIRKMIEVPGTFDNAGWLQIGFAGHQPSLAEHYISTGSLYLCTAAFLPLGLPPADEFWSGADSPWTSRLIWSGEGLPPDHAIADSADILS